VLKYDDVMNDQRKEVYSQRRSFMQAADVAETVAEMRRELVDDMVARAVPENSYPDQWDLEGLQERVLTLLGLDLPVAEWGREEGIDEAHLRDRIQEAADQAFAARAANIGPERMREIEKSLLLMVFDKVWKDHLLALDHLRQGIGLRAYAQRDPLNEYKSEAFNLFNGMLFDLREDVTRWLMHVNLMPEQPLPTPEPVQVTDARQPVPPSLLEGGAAEPAAFPGYGHATTDAAVQLSPGVRADDPSTWDRTPRNAPCPCGSGKKYKHCHGKSI
jgi:preprotein translocase subunit SecA